MGRFKIERKKWTLEEDEYLKTVYDKIYHKEIEIFLNRSKGSIAKRIKTLGLSNGPNTAMNRLEKNGYGKDVLQQIVKESYSVMEVVRKLGKTIGGPTYKIVLKAIDKYDIDCSHFDSWKYRTPSFTGKPIEYYLIYGSNIGSSGLKEKLYKSGLKQRQCEKCGQGEVWRGDRISLILDHIDGDPKNNVLDNLRILCPNCSAALPTHCRGKKVFIKKNPREIDIQRENNGGRTDKQIALSLSQRKVERPSIENLKIEVTNNGFLATGRKYGVSDNTIRKWMK